MNWWHAFYDEKIAAMLLRSQDDIDEKRTLQFLKEHLHIKKDSAVFDQCCGEGRLSLPLLKEGCTVIGVDQCQAYIDRANEAHQASLPEGAPKNETNPFANATYFCDDAFTFVPKIPVDAAFNWWTSFGYALGDDENIRMIACAFASLKSGGRYALDFLNAPNILAHFRDTIRSESEYENGTLTLVRKSTFDFSQGTFNTHWTYTLPDRRQVEHQSRIRMYMPIDLVSMFNDIGFVDIELFGDTTSQPIGITSPRCIIIARKP